MKYLMLVLGLMLSITAFAEGYCEGICKTLCSDKSGIKYCVDGLAQGPNGEATNVCVCNSKTTSATSSSKRAKPAGENSNKPKYPINHKNQR
jgi:predicted transcriptional regulator with HTH domain